MIQPLDYYSVSFKSSFEKLDNCQDKIGWGVGATSTKYFSTKLGKMQALKLFKNCFGSFLYS